LFILIGRNLNCKSEGFGASTVEQRMRSAQ